MSHVLDKIVYSEGDMNKYCIILQCMSDMAEQCFQPVIVDMFY